MNEPDQPSFPPSGDPETDEPGATGVAQDQHAAAQAAWTQAAGYGVPQPTQPAQPPPAGYWQDPYRQQGYAGQAGYGGYQYPQQPYGAYGYGQPYYQYYYDPGPGNGAAVASLTLAAIAFALLFFTAGFSAPLSLILGIIAIPFGIKGKKAVDEGRTRQHRDIAQAGFWTGIGAVIVSILAAVVWVLFFVFFAEAGDLASPGDPASLVESAVDAIAKLVALIRSAG